MGEDVKREKILLPDDDQYLIKLGAVQYSVNYLTYHAYLAYITIMNKQDVRAKIKNKNQIAEINDPFYRFSLEKLLDRFYYLIYVDGFEEYLDIYKDLSDVIFYRNGIYYSKCVSASGLYSNDVPNKQILWYFDKQTNKGMYIGQYYLSNFLDIISKTVISLDKYIDIKHKKILN